MTAHPTIDAIGVEYLTLGLELERLVPGFVDAYMGPNDLKTRANAGAAPRPVSLLDRAERLRTATRISDYDDNRKEFLRAQITGMITSVISRARPAPSSSAASSISLGTSSMNERISQMASGRFIAV